MESGCKFLPVYLEHLWSLKVLRTQFLSLFLPSGCYLSLCCDLIVINKVLRVSSLHLVWLKCWVPSGNIKKLLCYGPGVQVQVSDVLLWPILVKMLPQLWKVVQMHGYLLVKEYLISKGFNLTTPSNIKRTVLKVASDVCQGLPLPLILCYIYVRGWSEHCTPYKMSSKKFRSFWDIYGIT